MPKLKAHISNCTCNTSGGESGAQFSTSGGQENGFSTSAERETSSGAAHTSGSAVSPAIGAADGDCSAVELELARIWAERWAARAAAVAGMGQLLPSGIPRNFREISYGP
jgi:hypothetical protein